MSNKVVMEVKAKVLDEYKFIELNAPGSFGIAFTKRSEINAMLNTKDGERFSVTIERMKKTTKRRN